MNNTIIRAPRRDRFVIIEQHANEDERLSWAASGLLGYLQAMVERYQEGRLTLVLARDVADIRSKPPEEINGIGEIEICVAEGDED